MGKKVVVEMTSIPMIPFKCDNLFWLLHTCKFYPNIYKNSLFTAPAHLERLRRSLAVIKVGAEPRACSLPLLAK